MKIEAIFGGVLALFVLSVAVYALATTSFPNAGGSNSTSGDVSAPFVQTGSVDVDQVCKCYNEGFKLAGSDVGVQSSQYRTGFEQCRAVAGVGGGDAWTAGWNARLSSRPYESSCRSFRKRSA